MTKGRPIWGDMRRRVLPFGLCAGALPWLCYAAFYFGGERALLLASLGLPVGLLIGLFLLPRRVFLPEPVSPMDRLFGLLDTGLRHTGIMGGDVACVIVRLDAPGLLRTRHGALGESDVLTRLHDRITGTVRDGDLVIALPDQGFALGLGEGKRMDLESLILLAARLQAAVSAAIPLGRGTIHLSASVGFCLGARAPERTAAALFHAANLAAAEASDNGPGAIRAFSADLALRQGDRIALRDGLEAALASGQIRAYFQPQVSTDTGLISGFEALARWHHPSRGMVSPAEFLPLIDGAGLSDQLAEVMLQQVLSALVCWDKAGLHVPCVGVNFSNADLRNPRLVEKMKWELDRFNLAPERLSVEILETVVADADNDIVVRNIAALSDLGCGIDLDDFGTGTASIGSIRRFAVRRIKIDRSLVTHVDTDRAQQRMIAALVAMADGLGLDTLAEGVETGAEHAMLGQLGCRHVQGFGIARPMPFRDTVDWITAHQATVTPYPRIRAAPSGDALRRKSGDTAA